MATRARAKPVSTAAFGLAILLAACGATPGAGSSSVSSPPSAALSTIAASSRAQSYGSEAHIDGEDMVPTLAMGDIVAVDFQAYASTPPKRGDIVVLTSPDQPSSDFIICAASGRATTEPQPLVIPDGQYFVMGDNRNRSRDSRFIGLIRLASIKGKVLSHISPGPTTDIYSKRPNLGGG
ncbi:MAG TPA: signal peptidase I [Candidatus Dormibacteraeota bacterium]